MNDWTPPQDPHENHPHFPFDPAGWNPTTNELPPLGNKRPPLSNCAPTTSKGQFEAMCAELLKRIDDFNLATMDCKNVAGGAQEEIDAARKSYDTTIADLNQFMGKTRDVPNPGYLQFLHSGSLNIEVVMSSGFVLAARIFGSPLLGSKGPIEPYGSLSSVCSSSYYSLFTT